MAKVTIISPVSQNHADEKIRVAAYCRVSSASDEQLNSYQAQMAYYSHKFENSETEMLVDLYADEGISGTSAKKRSEFQRMMKDCRLGKIDRIYTKSVSRFARNTKECLQYVRELKLLGITICFEKENLDTAKAADEMMITVMAGLAQEESVSISKNMKWALRRRMQNGTYKPILPYGFARVDGKIEIVEHEAAAVRQIFAWYLEGYGASWIADMLNSSPDFRKETAWNKMSIIYILTNERYMGDAVFQKHYSSDTVPFNERKNNGELPMYYVSGINEAIISEETFARTQEVYQQSIRNRKERNYHSRYPLSGKIICGCCQTHFVRKKMRGIYWTCYGHDTSSGICPNRPTLQEHIYQMFIRMFNKLYFCRHEILSPLLETLHELRMKKLDNQANVMEIQKKSAQMKEHLHVLATLRTKGFLSEETYREQTAELNRKIADQQQKLKYLLHSADEDDQAEQLGMLADFLEKRGSMMTEFEEKTFSFLVEKIISLEQDKAEFHIIGGLKFTEKYSKNKRGGKK